MKLELKLDENVVTAAYLRTIYDLIDELNCQCNTYLDEHFNKSYNNYVRTRTIEIYGTNIIIPWLKLRLQRYFHMINKYTDLYQVS